MTEYATTSKKAWNKLHDGNTAVVVLMCLGGGVVGCSRPVCTPVCSAVAPPLPPLSRKYCLVCGRPCHVVRGVSSDATIRGLAVRGVQHNEHVCTLAMTAEHFLRGRASLRCLVWCIHGDPLAWGEVQAVRSAPPERYTIEKQQQAAVGVLDAICRPIGRPTPRRRKQLPDIHSQRHPPPTDAVELGEEDYAQGDVALPGFRSVLLRQWWYIALGVLRWKGCGPAMVEERNRDVKVALNVGTRSTATTTATTTNVSVFLRPLE